MKTFTINKADPGLVLAGTSSLTVGDTASFTASAASSGAVTYASSNTSVATVSSSGVVTGVAAGTATITVTVAATDNYTSGTASVTVTVTKAAVANMTDATVTLGTASYTYDENAKTPSVTVTYNGTTLIKGTDYTVSYSNNTNAGTATVTVTGIGNYTGTVTKTFTISKASQTVTLTGTASVEVGSTIQLSATASGGGTVTYKSSSTSVATVSSSGVVTGIAAGTATITATAAATDNYNSGSATITITVTKAAAVDISGATVTLGTSTYTYDGKAKTPSVTVKVSGSTLASGTDYSVSYSNNINAGTAAVTVTGKGSYTGTVTKNFTINKASQTVTITGTTTYTVGDALALTAEAAGNGTITWTYSDGLLSAVAGSGTAGTYTVTASAAATDNYNAGSASVTVTYKPASVKISSVTNATSGITIKWGQAAGASGYYVYRKESSGSYSVISTITSASTVSYTDTEVKSNSGKTYTYKVVAYSGDVAGSNANTKTIIRLSSATISSVANATSGITVKWGKVTGANGYYIYRKVSGGSYSLVKTVTSGSTVSYTDTAVKSNSGKTYTYYVIPYYKNSSGTVTKGSYVNTKTIIRLKSATISSLTNTASGITVKWGRVTGANGYYVYRKASGGSYSKIKTITSGSTVSYTDTAVKNKNGTTYIYKVLPYYKDSSGNITKGSYANTKTTARLTAVSISSLTNSSSKKMTVKWSKNNKATGYQIQYSTSSTFASGNKTVTVSNASTASKVIGSLTRNKTYYVRVRAYKTVSGTKYYSAWSGKKSVKISK